MKESLIYFTEVALCFNLLYWVYKQFLAELFFFSWSRFYFLLALLVAFAIPFFDLPLVPYHVSPKTFFGYPVENTDQLLFIYEVPVFAPQKVNTWVVLAIASVYFSGVCFFLAKVIREITRIYSTKPLYKRGTYSVVQSETPAWSFFGRVIINEHVDALQPEEREQVLLHEQTHSKQLHSFDTVLVELATAILWFNPLMPKIKREMIVLHEFLADEAVTRKFNAQAYSRLILTLSQGKQKTNELVSAFTNQLVGRRIHMLNRPPQSELKKLRFLLVLPLVVVLLFSFSLVEHALLKETRASNLSNIQWEFPLKKRFAVVKSFNENEVIERGAATYYLSHPKATLVAESEQDVLALGTSTVLNVWRTTQEENATYAISMQISDRYIFVIEGLAEVFVNQNQGLLRGQVLGKTGKTESYPSISFELWEENIRIDPLILYE